MVFNGSDILLKLIYGINHSLTFHGDYRGAIKLLLNAGCLDDSPGYREKGALVAQRCIKITVLKICFVNIGLYEKLPELYKGDGQVNPAISFKAPDLIFTGYQGADMDQDHLFADNLPDHLGCCSYRGDDGCQVGHKPGSVFFNKGDCNRVV